MSDLDRLECNGHLRAGLPVSQSRQRLSCLRRQWHRCESSLVQARAATKVHSHFYAPQLAVRRERPTLRILLSKVVRFTPRRAAAPEAPPTTHLLFSSAFRM